MVDLMVMAGDGLAGKVDANVKGLIQAKREEMENEQNQLLRKLAERDERM